MNTYPYTPTEKNIFESGNDILGIFTKMKIPQRGQKIKTVFPLGIWTQFESRKEVLEEKFKPFGNQAVVLGLWCPESKSLVKLMLQSSRTPYTEGSPC